MPKRPVQPIQRWNTEPSSAKEHCPNRAVLNPNEMPQGMTYRPLRRKPKPAGEIKPAQENDHETANDFPTATEQPAED